MLVAELALQDLAGTGLGQGLGAQADGLRHLVAGDQRAAVVPQLLGQLGGRRRALPDDDDGVDGLPPALVRQPEDRGFEHGRVLVERVLDLDRVHVLAAAHDHVLGPVDEEQVALVVQVAEVARPVPALVQGLGGGLRVLPVAGHHARTAHQHLADLARRDALVVGTDDGHLDAGDRLAAGGEPRAVQLPFLVPQDGHHRRRLRGAVEVGQLGAGEGGVGPPHDLGRDGRGGVADQAQRARVPRAAALLVDHRRDHGRHRHEHRHAVALDEVEAHRGVERRQHDDGPAEPHEAQQRRGAGHVEERGDGQEHVVALEAAGQRLVERVGDEVPMGQHHALGPAGGPAGEEDRRRIVLGRRSGEGRSGRDPLPPRTASSARPARPRRPAAPRTRRRSGSVVSTASPNGPGSRSARRTRAPERRRASSSSGSAWRVLRGTITKPAAGTARWASTYRWQPAASTATRSPRCSPSAARAEARRVQRSWSVA